MKLKRRHREAIEDIMENFEWGKVQRIMQTLKWTWSDSVGVPSIMEMQAAARYGLEAVCREKLLFWGSGGFRAERFGNTLRLAFEVTDCDFESDRKL